MIARHSRTADSLAAHLPGDSVGDYRKLKVWQRARKLEHRVYLLIEKLPPNLREGARAQLGDAAESVRRNIAEGAGLNMDTLLAKHLRHSLGSANEVQDELDALDEKGFLPPEDQDLIQETTEVRSMLAAFLERVVEYIARAKKGARTRPPKRTGPRR
jgi:four helix bundle protein